MVSSPATRDALRAREKPNSFGLRPELHMSKNSRKPSSACPLRMSEAMVLVQEINFGLCISSSNDRAVAKRRAVSSRKVQII